MFSGLSTILNTHVYVGLCNNIYFALKYNALNERNKEDKEDKECKNTYAKLAVKLRTVCKTFRHFWEENASEVWNENAYCSVQVLVPYHKTWGKDETADFLEISSSNQSPRERKDMNP